MSYLPILLLLAFGLALVSLLWHFTGALAWAALLAIITWPLHQRLLKRGYSRAMSATTLLVSLLVLFIGPSFFVFNTVARELRTLESAISNYSRTGVPVPEWVSQLPFGAASAVKWWQENLSQPGALEILIRTTVGEFMPQLSSAAGAITSFVLANALFLFLALLTLFMVYLEGDAVQRYVHSAGSRVLQRYYQPISRLFVLSVRGTALGLCSVAVLEGVVLGVAYAIAGAPAPALLGIVTGYLALIPGGAPLSFTSVSLLLLGQGHPSAALGLFCWGAFELFLVDKFVRPKLIGHQVNLPFLAVLFGLLGGVSTLGVLGLFVGPFLMAVLFWWLRGCEFNVEEQILQKDPEKTH
ncbi:MAG: AI-2E family transporter [Burkholderiaceae bacterium]